jgi:hypothetical protein
MNSDSNTESDETFEDELTKQKIEGLLREMSDYI